MLKDGRTLEGVIADVSDLAVEMATDGDDTVRALFADIAKAQLVVKI